MGCESSHLANIQPTTQIKISVVDSAFMKTQNELVRKEMTAAFIDFDYFISLDYFFDEFSKRYYNKIITGVENYKELLTQLQSLSLSPNIYVVLHGAKIEESLPFNVIPVQNYAELMRVLQEKKQLKEIKSTDKSKKNSQACDVKVLSKPGPKTSEETIFQAALSKANISFEFYNSYQLLEQSISQSLPEFIVTDYVYHRQVIDLVKNTKIRVVCYCSFDKEESYDSELYSVSNNYLDITQDLKQQLKSMNSNSVKCTKAYLYTVDLTDSEEIQYQIQKFGIEIRPFNNIQKVIKETTYFFCVSVIALDSQVKNLTKYFQKHHYLERVKLISLPKSNEPTLKNLYKTIRNIKKGYKIEKALTYSIDIIDKHYDNIKFEQIKKQLETSNINCHGFLNLSSYIKNKKFISPFIICNYEERMLLIKYMKQLQCKAKIIIFCNKNKINEELKSNKNFSFVSSHFGKIIKFINKTLVFVPKLSREQDSQFNQKIEKLKSKNKRISALKWGQVDLSNDAANSDENFQFLNISPHTSNASIRDIQKTVSMLWKLDTKICQNFSNFRKQFAESLGEIRKQYQINYPEQKFKQLMEKVKETSISELTCKIKQYFQAENEIGLQINKSLINTQNLSKKQTQNLKEFLMLVFLNYCSAYNIPRTQKICLKHWMSNSLIEKCQINSYLFCKNFLIAYEDTGENFDVLSKIKLEIQVEYNLLAEPDFYFNSYITHKDKFIFSPFSQFQVIDVIKNGSFKIIRLKYIKNVEFLKCIFMDNLLTTEKSFQQLFAKMQSKQTILQIVDQGNKEKICNNLKRLQSIQKFREGKVDEAIHRHRELIKEAEDHQNLDSALVNELNYELACFTLKSERIQDASQLIKELMKSNPGAYIKQQCEAIIDKTLASNPTQNEQVAKFSEKVLQTFTWLRNSQQDRQDSQQDLEHGNEAEEFDEGLIVFDTELPCMSIDEDMDEMEKENIIV